MIPLLCLVVPVLLFYCDLLPLVIQSLDIVLIGHGLSFGRHKKLYLWAPCKAPEVTFNTCPRESKQVANEDSALQV